MGSNAVEAVLESSGAGAMMNSSDEEASMMREQGWGTMIVEQWLGSNDEREHWRGRINWQQCWRSSVGVDGFCCIDWRAVMGKHRRGSNQ